MSSIPAAKRERTGVLGNGRFAAGARRFGFAVGFRDLGKAFVDAVAFFGFAGGLVAFAKRFLGCAGGLVAFAKRFLGLAARFFIVNLPRAPSCP